MKQIPLLIKRMMADSIIAKRKTMTRRLPGLESVNENPDNWDLEFPLMVNDKGKLVAKFRSKDNHLETMFCECPYGISGDVLYGRENWFPVAINDNKVLIGVDPKGSTQTWEITTEDPAPYWKKMNRGCMIPSIHMPKEASRIWLEVTDIRVERLQDISHADAIAEGVEHTTRYQGRPADLYLNYLERRFEFSSATLSFSSLWISINGADSWNANPWAWVISFRVLSTTGKPASLEKEVVI